MERPGQNKERHGPEVRRWPSAETAREEAGKYLASLLEKYNDRQVLLLISGGSSLTLLEHAIPDEKNNPDAINITISTLDERYQEPKKNLPGDANNYNALSRTKFYKSLRNHGAGSINTMQKDDESFYEFSHRVSDQIADWLALSGGVVIVTQGIGPDGHTAGMLPMPGKTKLFNDMFDNKAHDIIGNPVPDKNGYLRLTATMKLLRRVDHAIVYAVGEREKGEVMRSVLAESGASKSLAVEPAGIVREMKDVVVFTDIPETKP